MFVSENVYDEDLWILSGRVPQPRCNAERAWCASVSTSSIREGGFRRCQSPVQSGTEDMSSKIEILIPARRLCCTRVWPIGDVPTNNAQPLIIHVFTYGNDRKPSSRSLVSSILPFRVSSAYGPQIRQVGGSPCPPSYKMRSVVLRNDSD